MLFLINNGNNFLLILIYGFKQKGKRFQKQDFKTLRGLLVSIYFLPVGERDYSPPPEDNKKCLGDVLMKSNAALLICIINFVCIYLTSE